MAEKQKKVIEEKEVKVYEKNETKMGETRLRLVSWIIDGKPMEAMFEKRSWVIREFKGEKQLQMSKAKGLTKAEMIWVRDNADKIIVDMENHSESILQAQVDNAQNKDWDFAQEEKVADEMFT